jgi:hypothetical protein
VVPVLVQVREPELARVLERVWEPELALVWAPESVPVSPVPSEGSQQRAEPSSSCWSWLRNH